MTGVLSYDESSGYTVLKPGIYIISITQDSKQREEVLRHEVIHALMELDPDFRAQVEQRWNNLSEGEQKVVRAFLSLHGYDVANNPELLLTEYASYWENGPNIVARIDKVYKDNIGHHPRDEQQREALQTLRSMYKSDGEAFVYEGRVSASMTGEALEFFSRESIALSGLLDSRISTQALDKEISLGKPDPKPITSSVSQKVGGIPMFRYSYTVIEVTDSVEGLREMIRSSANVSFRSSDIKKRSLRALKLIPDGKKAAIRVAGENILVVELDAEGNPVVEKSKIDALAEKQRDYIFKGLDHTTYVLRTGKDGKPERVVVDGGRVEEELTRRDAMAKALVEEQERRMKQEERDRLNRGPGLLRPGSPMKIDPNAVPNGIILIRPVVPMVPSWQEREPIKIDQYKQPNLIKDPNDAAMLARETVENWLVEVARVMSGSEWLASFEDAVNVFEENPGMAVLIERQLNLLKTRLEGEVSMGRVEQSFAAIQEFLEPGISLRTDAVEEDPNSDQPMADRLEAIIDGFLNMRTLVKDYRADALGVYDRLFLIGEGPVSELTIARAEQLRAQWELEMLNLSEQMLKIFWTQEFQRDSIKTIIAIDELVANINEGSPDFGGDPGRIPVEKARARAAGLIVNTIRILPEEMKQEVSEIDSVQVLLENYDYDFVSQEGRQTSGVRVALEAMHSILNILSTFDVAPENDVRQEAAGLADRLWELLYRHLQRDLVEKESWDAIERKVSTLLKRFEYRGFAPKEIAPEDLDDFVDLEILKAEIISDIESLGEKIRGDEQLVSQGLQGLVDEELDAAVSMLRTNGADFAMLGVNSEVVAQAVEGFANRGYVEKFWSMGFIQDPDSLDWANLMNAARHIAALFGHDQPLSARAIYNTLVQSVETFVASEKSDQPRDALPFIIGIAKVLAGSADSIPEDGFEQGVIADTVSQYVATALEKMPGGDIQRLIDANQAGTREEPVKKGGIDFNADFLDLRIGGEPALRPQVFSMNESFADRIGGLIPVIINITPVDNLPAFLMQ